MRCAGKRTLLIDLDPQANSTMSFLDMQQVTKSVYDAIAEPHVALHDVIRSPPRSRTCRSRRRGSRWPSSKPSWWGRWTRISGSRTRSSRCWQEYPQIVIDCPPTLGLLTVNALVAATHLLIPIQSSYFALEGTDDLLETIEKVRARPNPALRILGVVITMHDKRTALARDIRTQIQKVFGGKVFKTVITKSIRLEESPAYKESIFTFAPESTGATEYYQPVRGGHRSCLDAACPRRSPCGTTSTTWRRWPRRPATPIGRLDPDRPDRSEPQPAAPGHGRPVGADGVDRREGIIEPLVVRQRGDRFQIVAGERRYQAAVQVGLRELPVVIRDVDDTEMLELALIENLQRKDLTPFEESEALQGLGGALRLHPRGPRPAARQIAHVGHRVAGAERHARGGPQPVSAGRHFL